ncbi:MAG: large subunit ribosomal protein L18 [Parcubacteria group bacterium LiPW_72]|nr:MAG: large subunit ribosomal protein L18 [Parcubacteria group bacterium LiPW_72]
MRIREKREKLYRRRMRVRAKVKGTSKAPRLSVYRSLKHIYTQIINDEKGVTLISASDREADGDIKIRKKSKGKKQIIATRHRYARSLEDLQTESNQSSRGLTLAFAVGKLVAEKALKKRIKRVVFDRGGRVYHGQIKAVAEGARAGGLKF